MSTALHGVMKTHPHWYQRLQPALKNEGRTLLVPLPVQPGPSPILMMGQLQEACGVLGIKPHQTLTHQGGMWLTKIWKRASRDCVMCSDTDEVSIQTACKKYQWRVRASCKLSKGNIWTEAQLKRIKTVARICGHMTMEALDQSGSVLLQKAAIPLRCKK